LSEALDSSEPSPKPQDYSGLRDEIQSLAIDYETVAAKLWPRIQDNKSRWELHSVGLNDGYSKMIVDDIIIALNEALKSISVAGNKLLEASATADSHNPDDTATS